MQYRAFKNIFFTTYKLIQFWVQGISAGGWRAALSGAFSHLSEEMVIFNIHFIVYQMFISVILSNSINNLSVLFITVVSRENHALDVVGVKPLWTNYQKKYASSTTILTTLNTGRLCPPTQNLTIHLYTQNI